jgi:hypothetical protein
VIPEAQKAAVPPSANIAKVTNEVPESSHHGEKRARVNHFVIVVILKVIPYMNALQFSVVTYVVVIMSLRFAQM